MASLAVTMSANAPCRPVPTNLAKPAAQPPGWPSRRRLASPAASSSASRAVTAHPAPDFQLEGGALQRERLLNGPPADPNGELDDSRAQLVHGT